MRDYLMNVKKYFIGIILLITYTYALSQSLTQTTLSLQFNTGNPAPHGMPSTFISVQGKEIPIILDTRAMKSEVVLSEHALVNIKVNYTGKQKSRLLKHSSTFNDNDKRKTASRHLVSCAGYAESGTL